MSLWFCMVIVVYGMISVLMHMVVLRKKSFNRLYTGLLGLYLNVFFIWVVNMKQPMCLNNCAFAIIAGINIMINGIQCIKAALSMIINDLKECISALSENDRN